MCYKWVWGRGDPALLIFRARRKFMKIYILVTALTLVLSAAAFAPPAAALESTGSNRIDMQCPSPQVLVNGTCVGDLYTPLPADAEPIKDADLEGATGTPTGTTPIAAEPIRDAGSATTTTSPTAATRTTPIAAETPRDAGTGATTTAGPTFDPTGTTLIEAETPRDAGTGATTTAGPTFDPTGTTLIEAETPR